MKVNIHLGLHKTASTFLQKHYFEMYRDEIGYLNARTELRDFLNYILYSNDLEFKPEEGRRILNECLKEIDFDNNVLTISDEQLCGSPWDNATMRKSYFDRLNSIFQNAKYLLVVREQRSMVQSLYLQYIKTGGSCSAKTFLNYKKHPLQFHWKSYLNYGDYYKYIKKYVGVERIEVLYYEELKDNSKNYIKKLNKFLVISDKKEKEIHVEKKYNKSVYGLNAYFLRITNKFISSHRNPFLLLPKPLHKIIKMLLVYSFQFGKKSMIPSMIVEEFCAQIKQKNCHLPNKELRKKYDY